MIWKYAIFIFYLLCCICSSIVHAQHPKIHGFTAPFTETGLPFIQNYTPHDYNAGSQNWAIAQTSDGIMYFGNNNGLLVYDGVFWRLIKLPNRGVVKSLAVTRSDKVYVGGYNDLGYLAPDSIGILRFVSLAGQLDPEDLYFQDVREISIHGDSIFFQSREKLMLWNNNEFTIWNSKTHFSGVWSINKKLFVAEHGRGVVELVNDTLMQRFGDLQPEDLQILEMLPFNRNQMIILTVNQGLFLLGQNSIRPFKGKVNEYLKANGGREGAKLSNGWFSFATEKKGLVVMDDAGNLVGVIGQNDGIVSNTIINQFEDNQKGLWLATEGGLSRVEIVSPYSVFDDRIGVVGYVNRIYRHKGGLYAANAHGVLRLVHNNDKSSNKFIPIEGINGQAFDFISIGDTLLAASRSGTDMIFNNVIVKRFDYSSSALLRSKNTPNRIYIGLRDGLAWIQKVHGRWVDGGEINGVKDDIRKIVEDENGDLWLESQEDGVWKVEIFNTSNSRGIHSASVKHYRHHKELPDGILFLHKIKDKVIFAIDAKVYIYDTYLDSIVHYPDFRDAFGLTGKISPKLEDDQGNIWMFAQLKEEERRPVIKASIQADDSYILERIFDDRFSGSYRTALLPEANGVIWYGGSAGIIRQDLNILKNYDQDFNTHIRSVAIDQDSIIFGGNQTDKGITLPFRRHEMRFEYAATTFENESDNLFQSQLKGFDDHWSDWTRETKRDYTNIPEGDYTFTVRAKNIYGHVGKKDSYHFSILPPWHRTWWAYLIFFIIGALLVWLYSIWHSLQLLRKNLILEAIVKRRTNEIRRKNELLSQQTEKLKELDIMKTRLFANISHEFRTPLTLIKGPIDELVLKNKNKINSDTIKMIRRNADRLLNLVNQLLDLSKLDSGKLRLNPTEGEMFKCIRAAASAFSSHAASRNIKYKTKIPSRQLWAVFDKEKIEKIIYNLLSNAFKFSEDENEISFRADFNRDKLRLEISDTGCGIDKDKLPHIFDRFFQVDDSYSKERVGSGIGLALVKELVDLMEGEIHVESELGKGTIFIVVLPLAEIKPPTAKEENNIPLFVFDEGASDFVNVNSKHDRPYVLIIDDNHDMRQFIREQLEGNYNLIEALSGKKGLEKALGVCPDLIITDLMMPVMDGITLCKKLKTNIASSHIPVIMLTAKAGIENKLEGLNTGADVYLTKPFIVKELQVQVKNLIDSRHRLRELYSKGITIDPQEVTVTSLDEDLLDQLHILLEAKYEDSEFGVSQMEKGLTMSKTQLHRKLKSLTNHPPGELLRQFRLKRAAQLLTQNSGNITEVAYSVGFNSLSYFTRCFKELYGISPSVYKQQRSPD